MGWKPASSVYDDSYGTVQGHNAGHQTPNGRGEATWQRFMGIGDR